MERRIAGVTIRVVKGDICDRGTDAIVNAANDHLWMGGGVAGAIKRRGGEGIEREALRKGPIPVGSATATGAGNLPARHVIHAAVMGQDLRTSAESIRLATSSSLDVAGELGLASVAFPALGTGIGGFPMGEAACLMLQAIAAHARGGSSVAEVELVVFSESAYQTFVEALQRREPEHAPG